MDERFEKLLQNMLSEVTGHFVVDRMEFSGILKEFSLSSRYCSSILQDILARSGFEKDLLDYLKIKCPAAYDEYFERK